MQFRYPAPIVLQIRKYHVLTQVQGEEKYRDVYNAISLYLGMHDAIQTLMNWMIISSQNTSTAS